MSNKKSFKELQELFKKNQEEKKNNDDKKFVNNDIYPFWQMKDGEECIVRILPDKNSDENPNPFPISIPYLEHTLTIDGIDRKVASLENWGEKDPISELSQKFYKEEGKESENGKKYWRKKIDLLRALIIKDPLKPEDSEENAQGKIKTLRFGFQLITALNAAIASDEMDNEPWSLTEGYNFVIKKSAQGKGKSTYAIGSGFVRKSTDVSDLVKDEDLIDLRSLLPANPGLSKVKRMLDAHLTGSSLEDEDATTTNTNESDEDVEKIISKKESEQKNVEKVTKPVEVDSSSVEEEDEEDDLVRKILERNRKKHEAE